MKMQLSVLLAFIACFFFNSCKKEIAISSNNITKNRSPLANAGRDTAIMLPDDYVNLNGTGSYDPDGNIISFEWRQIAGAKALIAVSQVAKTTASNFSPGVYQFELKVTDNGGLSSKDTMTVEVQASDQTESPFYFKNLAWIFPWYASLEVRNIYSYVPKGKPFKVFIQRDFNTSWVEVQPISVSSSNNTYEYFIETRLDGAGMYNFGSLYIFYYGTDTNDTPNVKVEF